MKAIDFSKLILVVYAFSLVSCAHYFPLRNSTAGVIGKGKIEEYCIVDGNVSGFRRISSDDGRFGKIHSLLRNKYPEIHENCEAKTAMRISIQESEYSELGDVWVVTLGVIPGSYLKTYRIEINFENEGFFEEKIGRNIISVFVFPFFYWNKRGYEVIFESISSYIDKNMLLGANP